MGSSLTSTRVGYGLLLCWVFLAGRGTKSSSLAIFAWHVILFSSSVTIMLTFLNLCSLSDIKMETLLHLD